MIFWETVQGTNFRVPYPEPGAANVSEIFKGREDIFFAARSWELGAAKGLKYSKEPC